MALSWKTCFILTAAFFCAGGNPLDEEPLISEVKEIVNQINSYLIQHKEDQVRLPDLGNLTTDGIALTNIVLSNFSTIEYNRGPIYQQNQTEYNFNVTLFLESFEYDLDFVINKTFIQQQGHMMFTTQNNSLVIEGLVEILEDKSCRTNLSYIDFTDYGEQKVELQPKDIPNKYEVTSEIFRFISPGFIMWSIKALEIITSTPTFDDDISNIICKVLVP